MDTDISIKGCGRRLARRRPSASAHRLRTAVWRQLLAADRMIADRTGNAPAPGMPTIVSAPFRRGAETRISPPLLLSVFRKTGRYTDQAGSK
jgi:hypothetical protein